MWLTRSFLSTANGVFFQVILEVAGKDATQAFIDVGHSHDAQDMTKEFVIGKVRKTDAAEDAAAEKAEASERCRKFALYVCLPTVAVLVSLFTAYKFIRKPHS